MRLGYVLTLLVGIGMVLPAEMERPLKAQTAVQPQRYIVTATNGLLNRRVMGPVTESVQGVPAQPVDSFVYDGNGSTPIEGYVTIDVDPEEEAGLVEVSWTDEHGTWTYRMTQFVHPEHSSGVRIGPSTAYTDSILNEGITQNVYLHGDSTAGMPVLPTVFAYLAAWGPVDVTCNDRPFSNPYGIPAPQWLGHVMVTEGVRGPDGTVRTIYGGIYDPGFQAEGAIDNDDLEVHVVFHDERFPMVDNIPPLFQFTYHLIFENVSIQVVQADSPTTGAAAGRRRLGAPIGPRRVPGR